MALSLRIEGGDDLPLFEPYELPCLYPAEDPEIPRVPCVYLFEEDDVFYVGQTGNLQQRTKRHRNSTGKLAHVKPETTIRWQLEPDRERRLLIETIYILKYRPRLNRAIMLNVSGPTITEIRYKKFRRR